MPTLARRATAVGLACVLSLVLAWPAPAGTEGSPVVVTPLSTRYEPYRFFGERTVAVPLRVHATEGEAISLRARLVQLTSGLAVPIGDGLEVPLPRDASSRASLDTELSLPLPAVTRETDFELRIQARRGRDEVWVAAGRIGLRVYPGDLLGPIRRWATAHPLRVEADDGSLVEFLREQRIRVVGAPGTPGPGGRRVTLYAGPRAVRRAAHAVRWEGDTIVLFTERPADIPRLLIERTESGTTVTVEMRVLDRLATDPLAQRIVRDVFELIHDEKRSSTGGDVP